MRFFVIARHGGKMLIFGLALLSARTVGRAANGLPEWGMSAGPAVFMIRVEAIESPPLNAPVRIRSGYHHDSGQGWPVSSTWLEGYKVLLTNVTMSPWIRPTVEYIVYAMDSSGQIQRIRGTEALDVIPVNGEVIIITNQMLMERTIRSDGHNTLPGKLLGVRLRIYNNRNALIQDYAAPWELMVWQRWDSPLYTEGGGLIKPLIPGVLLNG